MRAFRKRVIFMNEAGARAMPWAPRERTLRDRKRKSGLIEMDGGGGDFSHFVFETTLGMLGRLTRPTLLKPSIGRVLTTNGLRVIKFTIRNIM